MLKRVSLIGVIVLAFFAPASAAENAGFALKDNDVWVMAGDSITAQHLHSNYFEAFCYARYPNLKFAFRNSGVNGHTIPTTMSRFDYDIAVWKPTMVSVELGMNDKRNPSTESYIETMGQMDALIRKVGRRPVYFSTSPINNGDTMRKLGGNAVLNDFAVALKKFAAEKDAPFADQFHLLIDLWGNNKPNEPLGNTIHTIRTIATNDNLEGVEHLRRFLAIHDAKPSLPVTMMGDPVHPGPPGQITMAAALLKDLGAESFVSSATLDAKGKVLSSKDCKIESGGENGGTIRFTRIDDCLPFPIPDDARSVLALYPTILELSQYMLSVQGLSGDYTLSINGKMVGTTNATELGKGINLTSFAKGPVADQGTAILAAVADKEALVSQARGQSRAAMAANAKAETKAVFDALLKQIEAADARIRDAAKPKVLKFELAPAK